mgnify:CR=1 FL=1
MTREILMTKILGRRSLLATAICGLMSAGAVANDLALEEVLVTAEKRESSLQDTPISLLAFSNERLNSNTRSKERLPDGRIERAGRTLSSRRSQPFIITMAQNSMRIIITSIYMLFSFTILASAEKKPLPREL